LKYARLKDIAEKAQVSVNTVSRALKGKDDIGLETQSRIRHIATELGYVPHAAAASLRSKTSNAIGVIVTFMDNPFYARILQGINDALSKYGFHAIIGSSNEDVDQERELLRIFASYRVGGMLVMPARDIESRLDYDRLRTRHVIIVRRGSRSTQSSFTLNSLRSGELTAEHFLRIGRRKPAYLGIGLPISCDRDRFQGFRRIMEEAGCALPPGNHRYCPPSSRDAYDTARGWMGEKPDFDCLFVGNDQLAFGVLRALSELGVKVPDDVAVVGHDDVENARFHVPSLSSVRVPKYRLGFESAEWLIHAILGDGAGVPEQKVYVPELVVRETSGLPGSVIAVPFDNQSD
jgi:LacI family transcriptional regulator